MVVKVSTASAVPPMSTPSPSDQSKSNPPMIRDKEKMHATPVTPEELPISAPPTNLTLPLRGQKHPAPEEVMPVSCTEEDRQDKKEDCCVGRVMRKTSDVAATSSMPRVHVEMPSPPKQTGHHGSDAPPLTAMGNVSS